MPSQRSSFVTVARPLAILVLATAAAVLLYLNKPQPEQQAITASPMLVDVLEVYSETLRLEVQSQGTVEPRTETQLSSEVRGKVIEVADNFVAGGKVRRGDVLMRIDDLEYRTGVQNARANLASAETQLAQERGRAEVALREWRSHSSNANRSGAAKALALREPQVAEARARLEAARAELARAEENLRRTAITAPYDGMVTQRAVDLGQHVQIGQQLGICFATDVAEVRLPVPEHKIGLLELGGERNTPIQLSMTLNGVTEQYAATLARVENVLDQKSRVLYVVAEVTDPYGLDSANPLAVQRSKAPLRIGSFVEATIAGQLRDEIIRVPNNVVQTDGSVWLIDDAGTINPRAITIINSDRQFSYVAEGINDGERIAMGYIDNSVPGSVASIASLTRLPPLGDPASESTQIARQDRTASDSEADDLPIDPAPAQGEPGGDTIRGI